MSEGDSQPTQHDEHPNASVADAPATVRAAESSPSDEMTEEQLAEAKQYARQDLMCDLADKALDVAYLAVMALVFAQWLDAWLAGGGLLANAWLRLAVMFLIVMGNRITVSSGRRESIESMNS